MEAARQCYGCVNMNKFLYNHFNNLGRTLRCIGIVFKLSRHNVNFDSPSQWHSKTYRLDALCNAYSISTID